MSGRFPRVILTRSEAEGKDPEAAALNRAFRVRIYDSGSYNRYNVKDISQRLLPA
jgi:hypothetical protein